MSTKVRRWMLLGSSLVGSPGLPVEFGADGGARVVVPDPVRRAEHEREGLGLYALSRARSTWLLPGEPPDGVGSVVVKVKSEVVDGTIAAVWVECVARVVPPAVLRELAADLPLMASLGHAHAWGEGADEGRALAHGKRRRMTDEHLRDVAEVYLAGRTRGRRQVATHFGVSDRTAEKWIARAREVGYLGPAPRPGKAGQREGKP